MFRVTHLVKCSTVFALSALMLSNPAVAGGFGKPSSDVLYVGGKKFNFHFRTAHPVHKHSFAPKAKHHAKKHHKKVHGPHVRAGHKRKVFRYHPHRSFRSHRAFNYRHGFHIKKH